MSLNAFNVAINKRERLMKGAFTRVNLSLCDRIKECVKNGYSQFTNP